MSLPVPRLPDSPADSSALVLDHRVRRVPAELPRVPPEELPVEPLEPLEILADDVLCGHGTAIGSLDDDSVFYLRSRGIPEDEAKLLLIRGFLADAIEGFGDESVHDAMWREIEAGLAAAERASP